MMRRLLVIGLIACSSPKPEPPATPSSSTNPARAVPSSQNEQLYAKGEQLEKEGRWEEAANVYQKYVFAMGDGLSYMDRSSMELRIKLLREKAATSRSAE